MWKNYESMTPYKKSIIFKMIQIVELAWKANIINVSQKGKENYEYDKWSNEYIKNLKTQTTKDK